jgi:hypothetical protein
MARSRECDTLFIEVIAETGLGNGRKPYFASGQVGMKKWVYSFGDGKAEGRTDMRNLLGGKGAGLAEMASLGLPVPPGFTVTTEVCTHFYAHDNSYPAELKDQVAVARRMRRMIAVPSRSGNSGPVHAASWPMRSSAGRCSQKW